MKKCIVVHNVNGVEVYMDIPQFIDIISTNKSVYSYNPVTHKLTVTRQELEIDKECPKYKEMIEQIALAKTLPLNMRCLLCSGERYKDDIALESAIRNAYSFDIYKDTTIITEHDVEVITMRTPDFLYDRELVELGF